mgnify:CR=1 FL=1|jgi:hypothetical protein
MAIKTKAKSAKSNKRQVNSKFQPGVSGNPKGPQKGYKKLKTILFEEKLEEFNHDPVAAVIDLAKDESTPLEIRARLNMDLIGYVYPKRKSIELEHRGDSDLGSVLAKAHERVKQARDNGND